MKLLQKCDSTFFETQCIYLNFLGTSSLNHFVEALLPNPTNHVSISCQPTPAVSKDTAWSARPLQCCQMSLRWPWTCWLLRFVCRWLGVWDDKDSDVRLRRLQWVQRVLLDRLRPQISPQLPSYTDYATHRGHRLSLFGIVAIRDSLWLHHERTGHNMLIACIINLMQNVIETVQQMPK